MEDSVVRFFSNARQATESSLGTKRLGVIRMVAIQSDIMVFQSFAPPRVQWKVQFKKMLSDPQVAYGVVTCNISLTAFAVPVSNLVRNEAAKRFLESDGMDRYRNLSDKAVVAHKEKAEDKFPTHKMDTVRTLSLVKSISDDKKREQRGTITFRLWISWI